MEPSEILATTRRMIQEHGGGDPDKWWYANRFVFARLMLDERKTKATIKKKLLDAGAACHGCGQDFDSKRDIHLHRLEGGKAYSEANCVLMHAKCHQKHHSSTKAAEIESPGDPVVTKWSKRYDGKPFTYWWDIAPPLPAGLAELEAIEFAKKDTRQRCIVPSEALTGFLTPERRTSRSSGNWGVKVMKDRPDELAFEPGTGGGKWKFLPVVWLDEEED